MPGRLIIVSRSHPDLYVYLRDRFAREGDVEVILDRRLIERRQAQVAASPERRRRGRRMRPDVDAQLRVRSHVIVSVV
jgi:hypothetical protein